VKIACTASAIPRNNRGTVVQAGQKTSLVLSDDNLNTVSSKK